MDEIGVSSSDGPQTGGAGTDLGEGCSANPMAGDSSGETLDEILRAAANERRRSVIDHLRESEQPIALAELAQRLARSDRTASDAPLDQTEVDRLTIELYHTHIPILADADVVVFDEDRHTIGEGETFERLTRLLTASSR